MPTPTYELIASATGNGSADTITLGSIPATYTDLVMIVKTKNVSGTSGGRLQFNGDTTGGNYSDVRISSGNTIDNERDTSEQYPLNSNPDEFSAGVIHIMNYSSTVIRKSVVALGGYAISGVDNMRIMTGVWRNTAAIYSVTYFNTGSYAFTSNSKITLYGIKAS